MCSRGKRTGKKRSVSEEQFECPPFFSPEKGGFWQRKGKGDSKSSRIFVNLPGGEGGRGRFVSRRRSICRDGSADLTGAWCCGLCADTTRL